MVKLTKHFTLQEMIVSQTASRRGIDNTPNKKQIESLKTLCVEVLEKIRVHYKKPVIVTSGFRSDKLNKAIGGSTTSQHSHGEAADFTVHGVSNYEVCKWIENNLNYDQLIYEFGENGWIHVSYRAGQLRNQELSAVKMPRKIGRPKTVYLSGIVK